jgi:glycerol uptake facilitator-like aquaporin
VFGGFLDQTVGTMILVLVVLALNDKRNSKVANYAGPVMVGITLITIGLGYGYNSGYALNPMRDLAPRCFTLIAGWGTKTVRYMKSKLNRYSNVIN